MALETHNFPLANLQYDTEKNILFFRVKQDLEVEAKEIREMIGYAQKVMGNKKHLAVVDFGSSLGSTSEARSIYANDPYIQNFRIADAFLVKSLGVRLVANFFIQVTIPKVKTRLFTDELLAIDWLLQQQNQT